MAGRAPAIHELALDDRGQPGHHDFMGLFRPSPAISPFIYCAAVLSMSLGISA
jgi:hypothetical protein